MVMGYPPPCWQTHTCQNITVKTRFLFWYLSIGTGISLWATSGNSSFNFTEGNWSSYSAWSWFSKQSLRVFAGSATYVSSFLISRAVSTSGATYLVTMACVRLSVCLYLTEGPPPSPDIIGSQKFQNQNLFQTGKRNFHRGTQPPPSQ